MELSFFGAAGEVTGSNYLITSGKHKILVDCGLFQGRQFAEEDNFEEFPFDASEIEAVFVTHAHLDHVGRIPKLYKEGFRGKIFSTPATRDCAEFILLDSEKLLCRSAERSGKDAFCTPGVVAEVLKLWKPVEYHENVQFGEIFAEFFDAGHILGSSSIRLTVEGKKIVFSGDLGNFPAPMIKHTEFIDEADYVVMESTYGTSDHDPSDTRIQVLEDVINEAVADGGVLMIPSFALERTQDLLYHLNELFGQGKIPRVPVFLDSPLAIRLTNVYHKYKHYFNEEAQTTIKNGDNIFDFPGLQITLTSELSKQIAHVAAPKIIIAGSGMSHGGRIVHHEKKYLSDPKNMLLFIGYQANGSLGRRLLDGAEEVKIHGQKVKVKAKRRKITSYSAHADKTKLIEWLGHMKGTAKKVFLTHGEQEKSEALAVDITTELGLVTHVPERGETLSL